MYDNIGSKIKGLAKAIFIVEAILSIIISITLLIETEQAAYSIFLFLGPILSWISSWLIYGFGEIIDKLCNIEQNSEAIMKLTKSPQNNNRTNNVDKTTMPKKAVAKKEITIIVNCPECDQELFFDSNLSNVECPYCGCSIEIQS